MPTDDSRLKIVIIPMAQVKDNDWTKVAKSFIDNLQEIENCQKTELMLPAFKFEQKTKNALVGCQMDAQYVKSSQSYA